MLRRFTKTSINRPRSRAAARSFSVATTLSVSVSVFAQNALDLGEADARNAAHDYLSRVEERFDCAFAEESMRGLGEERFIVKVSAIGEDCDDAMTYLVSLADLDDKLIFRRVRDPGQPVEAYPFIPSDALILEVNPEPDDDETEEDPQIPQSN